jgi:hypothetical protein
MSLDTRKRGLLCESELNRKVLQVEFGQWQLRSSRWQSRASTAQKFLSIGGALAQMVLPRKYSSIVGIARTLFSFRKQS